MKYAIDTKTLSKALSKVSNDAELDTLSNPFDYWNYHREYVATKRHVWGFIKRHPHLTATGFCVFADGKLIYSNCGDMPQAGPPVKRKQSGE
jgi:hypothetical protein